MQRFLVLIVGIIFIGVAIFMYFRNSYLVKNCTVQAIATVVDMKQELSTDDDGSNYMYYPIVEYEANGNTVRVKMDNGSSSPAYDIGEEITILYNPNKTKEFIVKGEKTSSIFSIIFIVFGVFTTGYGIKVALKKD